eukprot:gene18340-21873_t
MGMGLGEYFGYANGMSWDADDDALRAYTTIQDVALWRDDEGEIECLEELERKCMTFGPFYAFVVYGLRTT